MSVFLEVKASFLQSRTTNFFPAWRISSTAPLNKFPSLSVHWIPFRLFLQTFNNSLSANGWRFSSCLSSGGSSPLSPNESKCLLKILSIPAGREGKMCSGLLMPLRKCSQKHLGQFFSRDKDEGDSL